MSGLGQIRPKEEEIIEKSKEWHLPENVCDHKKYKYRPIKGTFPRKIFSRRRDVIQRRKNETKDKVEINSESFERHNTGAFAINSKNVKTKFHREKLRNIKKKFIERTETTARAELLNEEQEGFLICENGESTYTITQKRIAQHVDIASASKHFELNLERFGPYRVDYTPNGRHILLGGRMGHVAAFDWLTKKLHNEMNVMEGVRDIKWLHVETMYAVAQKRWTHIYDNKGTELHCLKDLHDVKQLEFLPRHFLLVAGSNTSYLHYLDVSMGKLVQSFVTRQGPLDVMTQNPNNAIIYTGHGNGTVQLWSPNSREALIKVLAHPCSVKGIAIEGNYMATTGLDRKLRIWDVRSNKHLYAYTLPFGLEKVAISQKFHVACGIGNSVQILNNAHLGTTVEPYLAYTCGGVVSDLQFCPFEDVLGIGHQNGLSSILVPGCSNPNFNALRANPFESRNQRREREVRQLLDKIQPELICLDASEIIQVNTDLMQEENERMRKTLFMEPRKITFKPRFKRKGKSSALNRERRKQIVRGELRFKQNQERNEAEEALLVGKKSRKVKVKKSVLDRFRRKNL